MNLTRSRWLLTFLRNVRLELIRWEEEDDITIIG